MNPIPAIGSPKHGDHCIDQTNVRMEGGSIHLYGDATVTKITTTVPSPLVRWFQENPEAAVELLRACESLIKARHVGGTIGIRTMDIPTRTLDAATDAIARVPEELRAP